MKHTHTHTNRNEGQVSGFQGLEMERVKRYQEGCGYDYKRATLGIFVVSVLLSCLIVLVDT